MSELVERIRDILVRDYGGEDCPAAQAVSDVLDKCARIEVDLWGKTYWPGKFIADEFRNTIADTLGVSTSDSPAGSAGVLVSAGDPTSPPRGPIENPVGSQPRGGEHPPQALITAVSVALSGHVWTEPLPVLPVHQWTELLAVIAQTVREYDRNKRWLEDEVEYDRTADAATYHQED